MIFVSPKQFLTFKFSYDRQGGYPDQNYLMVVIVYSKS